MSWGGSPSTTDLFPLYIYVVMPIVWSLHQLSTRHMLMTPLSLVSLGKRMSSLLDHGIPLLKLVQLLL